MATEKRLIDAKGKFVLNAGDLTGHVIVFENAYATEKGKTMTDREKLIELLGKDTCKHDSCLYCEHNIDHDTCITYLKSSIADLLLANGVTFAKDTNVPSWIPLTERYPEENKRVLLWCKEDGVNIGCYTGWGPFRVRLLEPHIIPDRPTHWMPLPEPPKEDNHD